MMNRLVMSFVALMCMQSALAGERLALNMASSDQLAAVDGISAQQADDIVALRSKRGRLNSVEELRILNLPEASLTALRGASEVKVSLAVAQDAPGRKSYDTPAQVLAAFTDEPTVQEVQQWANLYAKTNPELMDRFLSQASSFAALPQFTVDFDLENDRGFDYEYPDGTTSLLEQGQVDTDQDLELQLRWQLNEIVMSSEKIRVLGEARQRVKLRDDIMEKVTELYFERRRAQVDQLLSPMGDVMGQVKEQLRIMEITAQLDAFTGGRFSQDLSKK